jgi:ComF family protein
VYCSECKRRDRAFERGRALYEYPSAADAIYRFKYGGRQEYAAFFGEQMGEYLGGFLEKIRPDALVPVPLHKSRLRKRGYNQAALLARQIGRQFNIPVYDKLLIREKNTRPLKEMNAKERQNNLKKAFKVTRNDVKLEIIVVVDDIYTTGSTVEEAARTLKSAGAKKVYFLTLAAVADGGRL